MLIHLLADFVKPNHGAFQHSLMHLGSVKFSGNRESFYRFLHQPSNLFENEVLEKPVGRVVPEVYEGVLWSACQLLGHQVS